MLLLSTALKKGKWLPSRKCAVPSASANLGMIRFPPNLETTLRSSIDKQACKLKFRLGALTSCLCYAASLAVCFKGRVAGLDTTETGNEFSQPKF